MQKMKPKHTTALRKVAVVLDVLAAIYVTAFIFWMFELAGDAFSQKLLRFFVVATPMTVGAYSIGIVAAVHCKAFKNVIGIVAVCIVYVLMIFGSLGALMGMDGWSDVIVFFLPHIIIIGYIIFTLLQKIKTSVNSN